jgi:hypothetical protein
VGVIKLFSSEYATRVQNTLSNITTVMRNLEEPYGSWERSNVSSEQYLSITQAGPMR